MGARSSVLYQIFIGAVFIATCVPCGIAQDCHLDTLVHISGKHNQPVANVSVAELKAEVGGSPAKVISFSPTDSPEIILAIDASSSMQQIWPQSLAAARQLIEKTDDIETFVFHEKILLYAMGRSKSEGLLDQLSKQGLPTGHNGTALYDAVIELASRVKNRNAAIVVISDGDDDLSSHSSDGAASLFSRLSWPPVFGLILDYNNSDYKETDRRREYFKKIPAASGGMIIYPSSASKVPAAAEKLAGIVLNPFMLTVEVPRSRTDMAKLKLQSTQKDINLFYGSEIPPCDNQPTH